MKNKTRERIDKLLKELKQLQIEQEETSRVYQRAIDQSNKKEKELLSKIRWESLAGTNNAVANRHEPRTTSQEQQQWSHKTEDKQF